MPIKNVKRYRAEVRLAVSQKESDEIQDQLKRDFNVNSAKD